MGDIRIDLAQLEDQGRLGPLLKAVLGSVQDEESTAAAVAKIPSASSDDEFMAADDWYFANVDLMNCVWFAWDGETPVGAAVVNPFTTELQYLVVLPAYRRRGIGTRLLQQAVFELRKRGASHIKTDLPVHATTEGAEAFFAAQGFAPIQRRVRVGKALDG